MRDKVHYFAINDIGEVKLQNKETASNVLKSAGQSIVNNHLDFEMDAMIKRHYEQANMKRK